MGAYVTRRILTSIPTLLVIVTVAFFMMRIAPGGPFDRERALPPEIEKNVLAAYDLDQPLLLQYRDYLLGVLQGDFGPSFKYRDFTVAELLLDRLSGEPQGRRPRDRCSRSLVGIGLGTLAALRQNSARRPRGHGDRDDRDHDPELRHGAAAHADLRRLSRAGCRSRAGTAARRANLVLPVIALALPQIAYIARLTRGSMIEVLHANYVRTARAKGLRERIVVVRHALKGALLPVVSYLGPATAQVVTGSVVIETIFGIPGIGRYFIQGALEPRLHAGDGHGDRLRGADHPAQSRSSTCSTACSIRR